MTLQRQIFSSFSRRRFLRRSGATLLSSSLLASLADIGFTQASPTAVVGAQGAVYTPPSSQRVDIDITATWKFNRGDVSGAQAPAFDDTSWSGLNLPHCWDIAYPQGGGDRYQGIGWYRKHLTVDAAYAGRDLFLQFDAASQMADVYVNGVLLGEHFGGYAIFRFNATALLNVGSDNVIAVKVNNAYSNDIPPKSEDFPLYGGLTRAVHLVVTDPVHIRLNDFGSSGVYLLQKNVSATSADLQVTTKTFNDHSTAQNVTLTTVIVDANNVVVSTLTSTQTVAASAEFDFVQQTTIAQPHLWNGQRSPYLYHVYSQLQVGGSVVDLVQQPLGFRFYHLDPNLGFFLNGQYLDLHGVSMMDDSPTSGAAVSKSDMELDMSLVQEMGATLVRLSHYQRDQHLYDLADSSGMVLWAELALAFSVTQSSAFTANVTQQLTELIRQNFNHPSILFWSLDNELADNQADNQVLQQLNTLAHTEDVSRPTTVASNQGDDAQIGFDTDTRGYNRYYGWYSGHYTDIESWATNFHAAHPTTTFGLSEYGAGASIYQHQYNPPQTNQGSYFHPEEYQTELHEFFWTSLSTKPYIWCKMLWNMFDFASYGRNEGDTAGRNDKGMVTFDRQTRKDAFFWYKANWSSSLFTYITERRFTNRTLPTTDIKVYSNTSSVQLIVNGTSLGSKTSTNHIFLWSGVTLQPASNVVQALGTANGSTSSDSVNWNYASTVRISAGARLPYTDSAGKFYDFDHDFSGGTNSATSPTIAGTADQPLFQTYRSGTFSYSIPLVNGAYTLYLKFMEPTATGPGQRVFSVSAQGATILTNEDIYHDVGQNVALEKVFPIVVNSGILTLAFTPSVGNAIVSGFALLQN